MHVQIKTFKNDTNGLILANDFLATIGEFVLSIKANPFNILITYKIEDSKKENESIKFGEFILNDVLTTNNDGIPIWGYKGGLKTTEELYQIFLKEKSKQ